MLIEEHSGEMHVMNELFNEKKEKCYEIRRKKQDRRHNVPGEI